MSIWNLIIVYPSSSRFCFHISTENSNYLDFWVNILLGASKCRMKKTHLNFCWGSLTAMGHALMTKSNPCLMIPTPHRIHIIHNQIPNLFSPFFHRFTSTSSVTLGGSSIFVVKHIMDQYFCVRDRSTFYCVVSSPFKSPDTDILFIRYWECHLLERIWEDLGRLLGEALLQTVNIWLLYYLKAHVVLLFCLSYFLKVLSN